MRPFPEPGRKSRAGLRRLPPGADRDHTPGTRPAYRRSFQQDHHRGAFQAVPHEPIYHEGAFQGGIRKLNSRPHKGTPYGKGGGIIKGYRPKHGRDSQRGGLREPEQIHRAIPKGLRPAAYRIPQAYQKIKKVALSHFLACRKTHGVVKGPQPLKFIPALTTQGELPRRGKRRPPGGCASERMKTQRFSYFADFAARRPAAAGQFRPVSRGGTSCFLREAKTEIQKSKKPVD